MKIVDVIKRGPDGYEFRFTDCTARVDNLGNLQIFKDGSIAASQVFAADAWSYYKVGFEAPR